jgi:hypothetical protein
MKDSELREMAKNRVEFRQHLYIYIAINSFLIVINLWFSPMFWWFPFILFFWGIGLVSHYFNTYRGTESQRIEREYRKLKAVQKRK